VLHMCVVKRGRAPFRSSGAGLTAEAFCRP
jgi:hypothetical protein